MPAGTESVDTPGEVSSAQISCPTRPRPTPSAAGVRTGRRKTLETAAFYRLSPSRARNTVDEVRKAVRGWRDEARRLRISAADIQLTEAAFATD